MLVVLGHNHIDTTYFICIILKNKLEPAIIRKLSNLSADNFKNTRPGWVDTWARDKVRWYWSADALFWQLSIDHNIDVQSDFSWAPKVARKCESKHWYAFGADGRAAGGRAVYGDVITKFSGMGRFTYPWCFARESSAINCFRHSAFFGSQFFGSFDL